jgi:hypothetical protein
MTGDELNQAIARYLGWKWDAARIIDPTGELSQNREAYSLDDDVWFDRLPTVLPNWSADSNLMRKLLDDELDDDAWLEFMLFLCDVTNTPTDLSKWTIARCFLEATPRQLAEAFHVTKIGPIANELQHAS